MRRKRRFDVAPAVVYLALGAAFLITAVFLHCSVIALGCRMRSAEAKYRDLLAQNRSHQAELLQLHSPESLRTLMRKFRIVLEQPREWAIVEVPVPADTGRGRHGDGTAEARER